MFSIDISDGPLDLMIDSLIRDWGIMHGEGFMVLQRSDFVTSNNLRGEKLIQTLPLHGHWLGQQIRQVLYILPGENNTSIIALCAVFTETGTPIGERVGRMDERFDRIMETFEWTQTPNLLLREENRHFEEAGGFSIILPESWEAIEMAHSEFKVIRGPFENGFMPGIQFSITPSEDQLADFVDTVLNELSNHFDNFLLVYRGDFVTLENLEGEKVIFHLTTSGGAQQRQIVHFFPGKNDRIISAIFITLLQAGTIFDERFSRMMETFKWESD